MNGSKAVLQAKYDKLVKEIAHCAQWIRTGPADECSYFTLGTFGKFLTTGAILLLIFSSTDGEKALDSSKTPQLAEFARFLVSEEFGFYLQQVRPVFHITAALFLCFILSFSSHSSIW